MHLFTSKSSNICNNENIGPSENFTRRIYKIPVDFRDYQEDFKILVHFRVSRISRSCKHLWDQSCHMTTVSDPKYCTYIVIACKCLS